MAPNALIEVVSMTGQNDWTDNRIWEPIDADKRQVQSSAALPHISQLSPSPSLEQLATTLHLSMSKELVAGLAQHGIETLADIRNAAGIAQLGEPTAADDATVKLLEAHAELSGLSSDLNANAALIVRGFISPAAISSVSREQFCGRHPRDAGRARSGSNACRRSDPGECPEQHAHGSNRESRRRICCEQFKVASIARRRAWRARKPM
jgi:hypothetical protein